MAPDPSRQDPAIESSIPRHFTVKRTRPKRAGAGYTPPYPSYSVRFAEGVSNLVCAFLGVQSRAPLSHEAKVASAGMWELCANEDAPMSREHAVHTDEQGFDNQVIIAYWDDVEAYGRWFKKHRDALIGAGLEPSDYGRWIEAVTPEARRFETLYSSNTFPEGAARMATGGFTGEIQEHGYWGSMRDRLPIAQTDALEPVGDPVVPRNPGIVRVEPHDNLAVIRSGQDWSLCDDAERASYFSDVEPQLKAGMDFLTTEGASIGCYANRYMTSSDGNGNVLEQSFGLSFWHSLEDMERWAESHPTHVAIFRSAMTFLQANAGARLRLSHEVAVVSRDQQYYEYNNCHAGTGMLGARRPLGTATLGTRT
ncbi:phenylacetaldoxime dehydratase family protein [Arthrobacter sp. Rue61a]|uniref:phenylacetaldoxime dehydratase family protein n=1 Tax=Arthrobacter sp. Rue61a TaxID=1118963 RepID=UPI00027DF7A6|nr:phenylacetaldoxime dehydratase family protein [Arthrobacter sp. Rue61a]AFR28936.1 phenylacetaldoxime dehydratase Oxd [Arthrobacter sp. Rue61a]